MSDAEKFIDAHSDDILYLEQSREALIMTGFAPKLIDASMARLLVILVVAVVDQMIEEIYELPQNDDFLKRHREPIVKLIVRLGDAFERYGIMYDKGELEFYAAVKTLRNRIIHSDDRKNTAISLASSELPEDVRELDYNHFLRIKANYGVMMVNLLMLNLAITEQ